MCVWSAYAGKKSAAPILWDSIRKIEGMWAGFYTGLVTLDQGEFHLGKCAGCTDCWRKEFKLEDFPGTAGLLHSRTNSGGDWKYSHPFVGWDGKVAAVSQGSTRKFASENYRFGEKGDWLLQQGRSFRGRTATGDSPVYKFKLTDGSKVPLSEITTNLTEYYYEQTGDPLNAMKRTAIELPEESATIFLFADRPDTIGVININQHVVCLRSEDSVMLSITTLGLPAPGMEIPGNTVALLSPASCILEPIAPQYEMEPAIPQNIIASSVEYLKKNPGALMAHMVDQAIAPLFPPTDKLIYRAVAGYKVLETLASENRIRFEEENVEGCTGAPGRIFRIYLK